MNRSISTFFSNAAHWTAQQCGKATTFALAFAIVLTWGATGPFFHFSDTWQLIINTGTTIVTFLMVFLLQHAQNRDSQAIQLKLDELIRVNKTARNTLLTLEDVTEEELEKVKKAFARVAKRGDTSGDLEEVQEQLIDAKRGIEHAQDKIEDVKETTDTA